MEERTHQSTVRGDPAGASKDFLNGVDQVAADLTPRDVARRSRVDRLQGEFAGTTAGHQDDRKPLVLGSKSLEKLEASLVGQVRDDGVGTCLSNRMDCGGDVAADIDVEFRPPAPQKAMDQNLIERRIFDDDNAGHGATARLKRRNAAGPQAEIRQFAGFKTLRQNRESRSGEVLSLNLPRSSKTSFDLNVPVVATTRERFLQVSAARRLPFTAHPTRRSGIQADKNLENTHRPSRIVVTVAPNLTVGGGASFSLERE